MTQFIEKFKWYEEEKTAEEWREEAERGDSCAQNNFGFICLIKQCYEAAFEWFTKSANQRCASGQYHLGWMYLNGKGTKKDEGIGMYWMHEAAEQGFLEAKKYCVNYNTRKYV